MTSLHTVKRVMAKLLLAVMALAFTACAPEKKAFDTSELFWPKPPDPAKVKYLTSYRDNRDIEEPDFVTRLLGSEGASTIIGFPRGVAVDEMGRIFVACREGVLVFDFEKKVLYPFTARAGKNRPQSARDVAIGPGGDVYVSDSKKREVLVYDKNGFYKFSIGQKGQLVNPQGITIDKKLSRLIVCDTRKQSIFVFDLKGNHLFTIHQNPGDPPLQYVGTSAQAAVDSKGNIYAIDPVAAMVRVFDKDGKGITTFGEPGDGIGNFSRPKGIAIDSEDHIYVSDAAFGRVQMFNTQGQLLMFFSQGGTLPGSLDLPGMLHIDHRDRIYVVERQIHRVSVFQYMGGKYNPAEDPTLNTRK